MSRRVFVIVLVAGAAYLLWCIVVALVSGNLFEAGGRITREPWGWVTIVDLYLGFLVAGGIIVWREQRPARWLPWLVAILLVGNLATAAYLVTWLRAGPPPARP